MRYNIKIINWIFILLLIEMKKKKLFIIDISNEAVT